MIVYTRLNGSHILIQMYDGVREQMYVFLDGALHISEAAYYFYS